MEAHSKWVLGIPIIAIIEIVKGSAGVFILVNLKAFDLHLFFLVTIVVICICKVILGIGLLMKKKWARLGIIGLMVFLVPSALVLLFLHNWGMFYSGLLMIGCLIACFYIYYFYRQDIRGYFQNKEIYIDSYI